MEVEMKGFFHTILFATVFLSAAAAEADIRVVGNCCFCSGTGGRCWVPVPRIPTDTCSNYCGGFEPLQSDPVRCMLARGGEDVEEIDGTLVPDCIPSKAPPGPDDWVQSEFSAEGDGISCAPTPTP